jgi:pimeloyl-ACP methyl ester carboxylesterase
MIPEFMPSRAAQLTEATSVAMVQGIVRSPITVPRWSTTDQRSSAQPIPTAIVAMSPDRENRDVTDDAPIMLLHGFDSSLLEFRRLLPLLGERRSAFAVDLLGFGFTDRAIDPDFDFTPENIKSHLYNTWKTLVQKPMVLVGASMGGAAAIDFALTYPEAVEKLILIDGAGFAKGPAISGFLSLFPAVGRVATNFLSRPNVRRQVSVKAYHNPAFVTEDAEICASLHLDMPGWSDALIRFTCSGGYNFLADKIGEIAQPTLVLWGRQDRILGTQDASRFERTLPQGKLVWVENCGHVPHLEQAPITAAAIDAFIVQE